MPDELPFLIPQIRAVLREAFEGGQGSWTYFIDNRPNTGMLGTIDALTAAQASQPSGAGDSTVAAHLHHVCFSLEEAAAFIRGDHSPRDWSESWKVRTVDDAAWGALRARVRRGYEAVMQAVEADALMDEVAFGGTIGLVAHMAYHLGAIRQKAAHIVKS
jgi:hypothetical protein